MNQITNTEFSPGQEFGRRQFESWNEVEMGKEVGMEPKLDHITV